MKRRMLSALLAVCLLTTTALAAEPGRENFVRTKTYEGQFSDLTVDSVFYDNVSALYEYGLSGGKLDGSFGLQDPVSVSQILIFAGRIRSLYQTGDPEAGAALYRIPGETFHSYLAYLQAEGVVGTELEGSYMLPATRAQVAHVLARALPQEEFEPINDTFLEQELAAGTFLPDVTADTPYREDILFLYRAGVSVGSDDRGSFFPDAPITRGATAAMLTRMVDPSLRLALRRPELPLYTGSGLTMADLVSEAPLIATPETQADMDSCIRYMLARGDNSLDLYFPGISVVDAREKMYEALYATKRYCEQGYNAVSCALLPDGTLQLSFSSAGAGGRTEDYRTAAMEAAIAVHDELWSSGQLHYGMTETERARVLFDWVCANCTYDPNADNNSLSHLSYQLFERGLAVCDGYTGAYNLLLKLDGIACTTQYNENHIWTVALLDGAEVHIDTTWGDTNDVVDDFYFAMTPEEAWAEHPW